MNNLTPEEAGSSTVALAITKRILRQPAMALVRYDQNTLGNLDTFCGHLAREVDEELKAAGLTFRMSNRIDPDITLTPSEQGFLDGLLARDGRGDSVCQASRTAKEVTQNIELSPQEITFYGYRGGK